MEFAIFILSIGRRKLAFSLIGWFDVPASLPTALLFGCFALSMLQ